MFWYLLLLVLAVSASYTFAGLNATEWAGCASAGAGGGCVGTWLTRDLLSMVWTSGIKVDQAFLNVARFAYEMLVFF